MTTKKVKLNSDRNSHQNLKKISKSNFNFLGNQRKTMRQLIFNLQFQLKKQNKNNTNKCAKQCTNTDLLRFTDFGLVMPEKELLVKSKLERMQFTNKKQKFRLKN